MPLPSTPPSGPTRATRTKQKFFGAKGHLNQPTSPLMMVDWKKCQPLIAVEIYVLVVVLFFFMNFQEGFTAALNVHALNDLEPTVKSDYCRTSSLDGDRSVSRWW